MAGKHHQVQRCLRSTTSRSQDRENAYHGIRPQREPLRRARRKRIPTRTHGATHSPSTRRSIRLYARSPQYGASRFETGGEWFHIAGAQTDCQNILMCDRSQMPRIKLADFGLAKVENLVSENTICGTKAYLPPPYNTGFHPQAIGMNWASDSYALGVITYQM